MDIESARNPDYWRNLVPELTVSTDGMDYSHIPLNLKTGDTERTKLIEEGYIQFNDVLDNIQIDRLRKGVATLHEKGWLPIFAFMYDEFWMLTFQLNKLLRFALGDDVKMMPDFWVWRVDPQEESSGWGPHRDKVFNTLMPDGMPKSATVWIPLSDATPLNGCMYMIPANRDAEYMEFTKSRPEDIDLQAIRALPAKTGAAFIWNQRVFHWGAQSSRHATEPRVSVAFEFQRGDVPPFNQPLLKVTRMPAYELRTKLIAKQILQYTHMYNYSDQLLALAQNMIGGDARFLKKR